MKKFEYEMLFRKVRCFECSEFFWAFGFAANFQMMTCLSIPEDIKMLKVIRSIWLKGKVH